VVGYISQGLAEFKNIKLSFPSTSQVQMSVIFVNYDWEINTDKYGRPVVI
jgi:hypothetical protein